MRVLEVCESFGGGVLDSVVSICNALSGVAGVEVHVCLGRRKEAPQDIKSLFCHDVALYELPVSREIDLSADLRGCATIRRIARDVRPDVVHLHSSKAGFLGRLALARGFPRTRVFYTPQGWAFLRSDRGRVVRLFYKLAECVGRTLGGTIVACSRSEAELAPGPCFGRPNDVVVIENAAFGAAPTAKREASGAGARRVRVGTAGRLTPQKDPALFLDVCRGLRDLPVDFVWIGGGDSAYEEMLTGAGVETTGWLPQGEALERLAGLDVYLQTSRWEGLPIAVLQAMRAGIPVVATDVAGNRDAVEDGHTGFVANGARQLSQAVRRLACDDGERRRMGDHARRAAEGRFAETRYQEEILALYGLPAEAGRRHSLGGTDAMKTGQSHP